LMGFASLNPSYRLSVTPGHAGNSSTKAGRWERSFAIFLLTTSPKIYCGDRQGRRL